jgi:hypothetical protein
LGALSGYTLQSTPGCGFDKLSLNRQAQPEGVGFPLLSRARVFPERADTQVCPYLFSNQQINCKAETPVPVVLCNA